MRIIPAIDLIDGKCVRLTQGDYASAKIYNEDPVEVAKEFEAIGIRFLHLVDLDAAKDNKLNNRKILKKIASATCLKIDFGGGIKTEEDIVSVFDAGASQVNIGTAAAINKELFLEWLSKYSPEKIILSADSKDCKIHISGWQNQTEIDTFDYLKEYVPHGLQYCVCTDISRDGMLKGPSTDLYRQILKQTKVKLVASGGISTLQDIDKIKLAGCEGVIIGKAIYEGRITLKELGKLC